MIKFILCRLTLFVCILWISAFGFNATCQAQEPGQNVWTSQDIGAPALSGSTTITGTGAATTFVLQGCGNYWGTADTGRFCYQPLTGDGSLVAEVMSITGTTSTQDSAGVMIRATTGTNSQMALTELTSGSNAYYVIRTTTGGSATSASVGSIPVPYWIKVVRSGASFSGYISASGSSWTQVGTTTTMNLPDTIDIGLDTCSAGSANLITSTFKNVTLTQSNSLGNGVGLQGEYFNSSNFTNRAYTRFDSAINFPAGIWNPTPGAAITSSTFSARWTGTITPRYTETYTFNATYNGGVNIWVYPLPVPAAGESTSPIISGTGANGNTSGQVAMTAGGAYRIEVDYTTAGQSSPGVTLNWSSANQTSEVVPMQQLVPAYAGKGRVLDEKWLGMPGNEVSNLINMANYPNHPTGRHFLTTLDIGNNMGGNAYGDQMSGYIYPPETGNYTFYIAGMDEAQLWMSPSESSTASLKEICDVPSGGSTGYLQWTAYPSQTSTNIYLYASQRYYFKVLHAGGQTGGDNCAIGWTTPSGIVEKPMPAERVSPYEAVTTVPTQSALFNTLATGHPRLFTDAQGFAYLKALALTGSTQQNIWYLGLGGTAATTSSLGNPVSGSLLYAANAMFALPPTSGTTATGGDGGSGAASYLDAVRQVESRVELLGMAYNLSGNLDYLNRAWEELDCAGGVTVTPNSSLGDTWTGSVTGWTTLGSTTDDLSYAEMVNACAVGYDWLYNGLSTTQISFIEAELINTMKTQLTNYEAGPGAAGTGVIYYGNGNHTDVDFGSTCTGAFAIANDPQTSATDNSVCAETLNYALESTTYGCLTILGPDGADPESPDYDMYLTDFLGNGFASLEAANAGDMGLTQQAGQAKLGGYAIGVTGPNSALVSHASMFNYNDCWDVLDLQYSPAEFWYGWKYDQSVDAWSETLTANGNGVSGPNPFDLLWCDTRGTSQNGNAVSSPYNAGVALDTMYRTSDIMTFRTSYNNPSDAFNLFAAIKGGDTTTGHAHLAQGTFLYQAYGIEWASLLGFDSYGLNEYFCDNPTYNPDRWQYYRCRAEGANTLVIGPNPVENGQPDQNPGYTGTSNNPASTPNSTAQAKVIKFSSTPTVGETILNLSALYPNAQQTLRGLQMNRPSTSGTPYMILQDEITTSGSMNVYWFMHYCYEVDSTWIHDTIQTGSTSTLETCGGKTMFLKILSPAGAYFYDTAASPLAGDPNPSGQNPNNDSSYWWKKLAIHYVTPTTPGTTTISILIYPGGDPKAYPTVVPLKNW